MARKGTGIEVLGVLLHEGDSIRFSNFGHTTTGRILSIDHGARYPIRMQWEAPYRESRITRFTPNEFLTVEKEYNAQA